jgi:hypothetical protein
MPSGQKAEQLLAERRGKSQPIENRIRRWLRAMARRAEQIELNRGGSRAKSKCGSRVCRPDAAFSQSADGSSSSDSGAGLFKFRRIDDDLT